MNRAQRTLRLARLTREADPWAHLSTRESIVLLDNDLEARDRARIACAYYQDQKMRGRLPANGRLLAPIVDYLRWRLQRDRRHKETR
jgi:hypothetical protein